MKQIRVNNQIVCPDMVEYDIMHNGNVVTNCQSNNEVWQYYFRKEKEVIKEKGTNWSYIAIGIHGLTMFDNNTDYSKRNEKTYLEWTTVFKIKEPKIVPQ